MKNISRQYLGVETLEQLDRELHEPPEKSIFPLGLMAYGLQLYGSAPSGEITGVDATVSLIVCLTEFVES